MSTPPSSHHLFHEGPRSPSRSPSRAPSLSQALTGGAGAEVPLRLAEPRRELSRRQDSASRPRPLPPVVPSAAQPRSAAPGLRRFCPMSRRAARPRRPAAPHRTSLSFNDAAETRRGGGRAGRGGAELPAPRGRGTASGEPPELPFERRGWGRPPGWGQCPCWRVRCAGRRWELCVVRSEIEVVVVSRERRRCERGRRGQVLCADQA